MPEAINAEISVTEVAPETWADMAYLVAAHARDAEEARMFMRMLGVPTLEVMNALREIRGQGPLRPVRGVTR